jgi:hypothetical protein
MLCPVLGGTLSNPIFEILLRLETAPEPFGKQVEFMTSTDMAMNLSKLLIKGKDIKHIEILNFKKLEAKDAH